MKVFQLLIACAVVVFTGFPTGAFAQNDDNGAIRQATRFILRAVRNGSQCVAYPYQLDERDAGQNGWIYWIYRNRLFNLLTKLQATLLQKVEELTLYILELESRIANLEGR